MHVNSLLHVRDHAKVQGTAHHLLEYIALHVNQHTGEAFELSVDRLAHRLDVTPQWVRQLRARLVAAGELEIQQSRGRRPNIYRILWVPKTRRNRKSVECDHNPWTGGFITPPTPVGGFLPALARA